MADFYHIYVEPKPDVSTEEVQDKMDLAIDWFRYDRKIWVVYTSSQAIKWHARLKPLVVPGGHLFICKLDPSDHQGWMNRQFWAWLKEER